MYKTTLFWRDFQTLNARAARAALSSNIHQFCIPKSSCFRRETDFFFPGNFDVAKNVANIQWLNIQNIAVLQAELLSFISSLLLYSRATDETLFLSTIDDNGSVVTNRVRLFAQEIVCLLDLPPEVSHDLRCEWHIGVGSILVKQIWPQYTLQNILFANKD